jgi:hypothetical protein
MIEHDIEMRPYKGKQYAVYVDGVILVIGRLARIVCITKKLRGKQEK